MSGTIHLAPRIAAGAQAARVAFSVGRSLTAADFALQGRYIDGRLLQLAPARWGELTGLAVSPARYDSTDGVAGLASLTVGIGTGIGRDGRLVRVSAPITFTWADLLGALTPPGNIADGAYLLVLRSVSFDGLQGLLPDPARDAARDPLLDLEQVSLVEIGLSAAIGPPPASATPDGLALALNTLVAGLTETSLAAAVGDGVPVALAVVRGNALVLLSQAAGRLSATDAPLDALLLAQTRESLAMAFAASGADPGSAVWQGALRGRFATLPGAGELPLGLLLADATNAASCPFFPPGMGVMLEMVRANQAGRLLAERLGRPRLDMTGNTAETVTLALAVPDAEWTPDLLDMPRGDPVLAADTHLAYARARAAQVAAREAWIALYGGMSAVPAANAQALSFLMAADTAAQNLGTLLLDKLVGVPDLLAAAAEADQPGPLLAWIAARITDLSHVQPVVTVPANDPAAAVAGLAALGYQVADAEPAPAEAAAPDHAPVESDALLAPLAPALPAGSTFADWSAAIEADAPDPVLLAPLIDAGVIDPTADPTAQRAALSALLTLPDANDPADIDTEPGLLLRLATLQLFYAVLGRLTRAQELMLGAHDRLLALQRQNLDILSTHVSALAGGVPSDGSGLSFARMIPFFNLTAAPASDATDAVVSRSAFRTTMMRSSTSFTADLRPAAMASPAVAAPNFSQIAATPSIGRLALTPGKSMVSERFGSSVDIAQRVAIEAGALSQSPPFTYENVQYGQASHITPGATLLQMANTSIANLRDKMGQLPGLDTSGSGPLSPTQPGNSTDTERANYASVLDVSNRLLGDMNIVESRAQGVESGYLQLRDRLQSMEARIGQVSAALAAARDAFRASQAKAAQAAGDYAVTQLLVQEEVARVAAATAARDGAIAAATGLFYVRELQTVTSRTLPDGLTLLPALAANDMPECAGDHARPPAAIQPFLDQLLEVPLADWTGLLGRWVDLPDAGGLLRLGALRTARVAARQPIASFGSGAAVSSLAAFASNAASVFSPVFQATVAIGSSLALTQQSAFATLAMPDILWLPPSPLRTASEALRSRLEAAAGCIFDLLSAVPPSARFAWSSAAEAGTLPALNFAQWPIPATTGASGGTTLRRLAAFVNWMAAQLHEGSSIAGQTALGNLVLALLVASAHGDPDEAVTGTVASTGTAPRPGLPIRIVLNRPAPIGTVLNLLDATRSVVGTIRVADHDPLGTTATVVSSFAATPPTSAWTVAVPGARAPRLPS